MLVCTQFLSLVVSFALAAARAAAAAAAAPVLNRWEHWTLDDDHNHALDVFACLRNVSNDAEKQLSHMPSSFQEDIDTETEVKLGRNFATIF